MNIIKIVMIMIVILVTLVAEYIILFKDYDSFNAVYEKLPESFKFVDAIEKGKKCTMDGKFVDYMGRPLESNIVNCNTCIQYYSVTTDGNCQPMQYDGSACSTFGGVRSCPTKNTNYAQYKKL